MRVAIHRHGLRASGQRAAAAIALLAIVACPLTATSWPAAAAAAAHTIVVPRDQPTIQAALDAAAPGSTIRVRRGTYAEEIVIDKDVILRGDHGATIESPVELTPFAVHLPDGRGLTAIVRVGTGAHVRMSGFTVTGPIPCGVEVTGIQVLEGATLALSDTLVTHIQADAIRCAPQDAAGRAIVYGLPPHIILDGQHGSTAFGSVAGVTVDQYQHAGISVTGPASGAISRVSVRASTIRGGWTLPSFQYGIDIEDGATATFAGNTITGVVCGGSPCGPDPINELQGAGIAVQSVTGPVTIFDNRLSGNDVGIYQVVSPDCCRISENRLTSNRFFGIVIQDGDGTTEQNVITGGQVGIGVVADFVDTTARLRGDRIRASSIAAVQELECCDVTATAITTPH